MEDNKKQQLVQLFQYLARDPDEEEEETFLSEAKYAYYWCCSEKQVYTGDEATMVYIKRKGQGQDDVEETVEMCRNALIAIDVKTLMKKRLAVKLDSNAGIIERLKAYGLECSYKYPENGAEDYFATVGYVERNGIMGPDEMSQDATGLSTFLDKLDSPWMSPALHIKQVFNRGGVRYQQFIKNDHIIYFAPKDPKVDILQIGFAFYLEANFGALIDTLGEDDIGKICGGIMHVYKPSTVILLKDLDVLSKGAMLGVVDNDHSDNHSVSAQSRPYHGGNQPVRGNQAVRVIREVKRFPVVRYEKVPVVKYKEVPVVKYKVKEKRVEVRHVPPLEVKNCRCPPKTHFRISHMPNLRPVIGSHGTKIRLTFGKQDVPETVPCVTTLPNRSQTLKTAKLVCRLRNYMTDRGLGSLLAEGVEINLKRPVTQADVGAMAEALLDVLGLEEDEEDVHPPESPYGNYSISRHGDRWLVVAPRDDREQYLHASSGKEGDIMHLIDSLSRDGGPIHNRKLLAAMDKAMDNEQRNAYARRGQAMLAVLEEGHKRVPQFVVDEHFEGNRKTADGHLLLLQQLGPDPAKLFESEVVQPNHKAIGSFVKSH